MTPKWGEKYRIRFTAVRVGDVDGLTRFVRAALEHHEATLTVTPRHLTPKAPLGADVDATVRAYSESDARTVLYHAMYAARGHAAYVDAIRLEWVAEDGRTYRPLKLSIPHYVDPMVASLSRFD